MKIRVFWILPCSLVESCQKYTRLHGVTSLPINTVPPARPPARFVTTTQIISTKISNIRRYNRTFSDLLTVNKK